METFVEQSLKEIKNIDSILSNATDKVTKRQTALQIDKMCDALIDTIDTELKGNESLNNEINQSIEMRRTLNYDVRSYFMDTNSFYYQGEDISTGETFNEVKYDDAKKHYETWNDEKQKIEAAIEKTKNSPVKFMLKGKLARLEDKLKDGNKKYDYYSKIFEEEKQMKTVDREALEKEYRKKSKLIKSEITTVIEKNILEAIKANPSIVAHDVFLGDSYTFNTSGRHKTENNKYIYSYYDSREVFKKLSDILVAYRNKSKENGNNNYGPTM